MTTATGNFAELLWPGIKKIWGDTYNDYPKMYTKVFDIVQSDKAFEKYQSITGLPLSGLKPQGKSVAYVDPYQGYQKELVNATFGLGASITLEMYEDDQYNKINRIPEMMARSANQTMETLAWNVLNRAFNSAYTGADGQTLIGTSHPQVRSGSYSNALATPADLSQTSLETLFMQILDATDDDNLKISLRPKVLVVPTGISIRAEKILGSDQVTGSADNDKNVIRNRVSIVVPPWLTDPDAWFVTTDVPMGTGLVWQERRKLMLSRDNEFDTENLKFKQTWRSEVSWINSRAVYGSPGA